MRKTGESFQKWRKKFKNKCWLPPSFISKLYIAKVYFYKG